MKIQVAKHTDYRSRWMTAERTLFVTFLGIAVLVTRSHAKAYSHTRYMTMTATWMVLGAVAWFVLLLAACGAFNR